MSWQDTEPVRLYLYGLLAPVLAVLVVYGVVDSSSVALWIALGSAVLGVPAVEVARATVASPRTQRELLATPPPGDYPRG